MVEPIKKKKEKKKKKKKEKKEKKKVPKGRLQEKKTGLSGNISHTR